MTTLTRAGITRLTSPERLALIGDLWDSITDADVLVSAAQCRELDRAVSQASIKIRPRQCFRSLDGGIFV